MVHIKVVTHYDIEDTDCGGDYHDVEVLVADELVAQYGDYYHDKGEEKAEAFVDGFRAATPEADYDVTWPNVADRIE